MTGRVLLYVPGDRDQMVASAGQRSADGLILDLEDSVTAERKGHARTVVTEAFQRGNMAATSLVRINPISRRIVRENEDLLASVWPGVAGLIVPKVEDPEALAALDKALSELEVERGLARGSVGVTPLIETARGLEEIRSLATAPRVISLQLGERDLAADLGLEPSEDEAELLPWRSLVVAVSRAKNLQAPIGSAEPDFRDLTRLRETCRRLRRLGFAGRTAIHPDQIPTIRSSFLPSEEERAWALAVIESYERAAEEGSGVAVGPDGLMIDGAVANSARKLLGDV